MNSKILIRIQMVSNSTTHTHTRASCSGTQSSSKLNEFACSFPLAIELNRWKTPSIRIMCVCVSICMWFVQDQITHKMNQTNNYVLFTVYHGIWSISINRNGQVTQYVNTYINTYTYFWAVYFNEVSFSQCVCVCTYPIIYCTVYFNLDTFLLIAHFMTSQTGHTIHHLVMMIIMMKIIYKFAAGVCQANENCKWSGK